MLINNEATKGIVRLGDKELLVVPQKHAKLRRYLSPDDFRKIMSREYSTESYRLLKILIPALDPENPEAKRAQTFLHEWEFDGFPTKEAWEAYNEGDLDVYDEDVDPGPDADQIMNAFETALRVNGSARLGKLVGLVQTMGRVVEAEQEVHKEQAFSSTRLSSLGESPLTDSGTSPQTPSSNEA